MKIDLSKLDQTQETTATEVECMGVEAPAPVNLCELNPGELPTAATVAAWRNDPRVPVQVAEQLRVWEQQLVLMAWSLERIWRPTFWPHSDEHPRGLASILNADDRILVADCDHIWITNRRGEQRKLPKKV